MGTTELPARPLPLEFDPAKAAVLVIDMQNHFASPGGSWSLAGVDTTPIQALVPGIQNVLAGARQAGSRILYVTSPVPAVARALGMPPEAFRGTGRARWERYLDDVAPLRSRPPAETHPPGWNAEIVEVLAPAPPDEVIQKRSLSGFFETGLDDTLRRFDVTTLLFTGCTTSVCVESTLRDASFRGYDCVLLEDCVAEPLGSRLERTNHDATVHAVELIFGWVSDSDSWAGALERLAGSGAPA